MAKYNPKYRLNKKAFDTIIGTADEPGLYPNYRKGKGIQSLEYKDNVGVANPAAPSRVDFCCDVEMAIQSVLTKKLLQSFLIHYIMGLSQLSKSQQNHIEQEIGAELRRRKIYPADKYFRAIRRQRGNGNV